MSKILLLLLLALGCREPGLIHVGECGERCYPPDAGPICKLGHWSCDNDGGIECVDYVLPTTEVCNGLDDNCNGFTDEPFGSAVTCQSVCGYGVETCVRGAIVCTARQPEPEARNGGFNDCDMVDNDCDGLIDEPQDFPIEFCYSGDPVQLTYSSTQCRAGIKRCAGWHNWACINETLPRPETCNGKDDDCDGRVDEGAGSQATPVDLVVVMDNSGSMGGTQATAMQATSTWVVKYGTRPEVRFALVFAPNNDLSTSSRVILKQDFTDPATFNVALATSNTNGSGAEPTLDALVLLADYRDPLGLSWNQSANKIVVMYSDEAPQSYFQYEDYGPDSGYTYAPTVYTTPVSTICAQEGLKVYVFTNLNDVDAWNLWPIITNATGGTTSSIQANANDIEMQLDKIIQTAGCTP